MKQVPQWLGRPILSADDTHDLEQRAAVNEFSSKMPRHEAEEKAHQDYTRERRIDAAAHHLAGMRAAQGAGQMDEARKHGLLYELHLRSLGHEPIGPVPAEVKARMNEASSEKLYRFKAHRGDLFALEAAKKPDSPDEEKLDKAEKRQCNWRLGERRCKNFGFKRINGRLYCHVGHHAPKEKDEAPEEDFTKSERLATIYQAAKKILDLS